MDYDIEEMPIHIEGIESPGPSSTQAHISENVSEDAFSDDEDSENSDEDKKPTKIPRQSVKLPPHLKGLMGEANLRYARGDLDTAKKMCFEIIRQIPDYYEPYLTLAQMYESTNSKKFKAYLMLASHLAPGNVEIGCRLADLLCQDGEVDEAIKSYSRILSRVPDNLELNMKRLELLEQRGQLAKQKKEAFWKLHRQKLAHMRETHENTMKRQQEEWNLKKQYMIELHELKMTFIKDGSNIP